MKLILADADPDFCEILCARLHRSIPEALVETVADGVTLIQRVQENHPDLVIVNLLLPEKDGLAAMQAIQAMDLPHQPELMVLSGYTSPQMQEELYLLRPAFFTALPCDMKVLTDRIIACCRQLVFQSACRSRDEEEAMTRLLREQGLTMRCKGFSYVRRGLQILLDAPHRDIALTKCLYPAIAAEFGTTAVNVERAIRNAIQVAWQREGYLRQAELFRERPTNSEFLAVLADQLSQERRRRTIS